MIRNLPFLLLLLGVLFTLGCESAPNDSSAATSVFKEKADVETATIENLDFTALTAAIDEVIGKRFQTMQMDGMQSASYGYDGPINDIVKIVDPIARRSGFSVMEDIPNSAMGEAEQTIHDKMGFNMNTTEQRFYTHANGDMLTLMRMDIAGDGMNMKMLTVQMMNPQEMTDFYRESAKP